MREVRRENEWAPGQPGELVGLLLPVDGGQWVPATVFGAALGRCRDAVVAESRRAGARDGVARRALVSAGRQIAWQEARCSRSSPTESGCAGTTPRSCDRSRQRKKARKDHMPPRPPPSR